MVLSGYGPENVLPALRLGARGFVSKDTASTSLLRAIRAVLRGEIWARWLEHDPVRFVPKRIDGYRKLSTLFLDCGLRDEFNIRWGTRMLAAALKRGGVAHVHEEFEDGHMGINYRYERSLSYLVPRLG